MRTGKYNFEIWVAIMLAMFTVVLVFTDHKEPRDKTYKPYGYNKDAKLEWRSDRYVEKR